MRVTLSFAVAGFVIATAAAICMAFQAPEAVIEATLALSPALYLFFERIFASLPINNWQVAESLSFAIVAVINSLVYGMAGAVIAGLLRIWTRRDRSTKSANQRTS